MNGYAFFTKRRPDDTTLDVAGSLGIVTTILGMSRVQTIRPSSKHESSANLYSGNYGLDQFPLHTDLAHWYVPPRFIVLRCISPATKVFTMLRHRDAALAGLSSLTIRRALYQPRRRLNNHLSLLRLLQSTTSTSIFRWDQLFLNPANAEAEEVTMHLRRARSDEMDRQITFKYPGDTLLVDNWSVLHGRSPVPPNGTNRYLERVYLAELK